MKRIAPAAFFARLSMFPSTDCYNRKSFSYDREMI